MSGIAGIIHFDGAPVEPGLVEGMTSAMLHRGPDGIRHWIQGSVALGQCMLCTTPESLEEKQPLTNEDESLVLVMDGRVDNWEELRQELLARGAVLRNRTDAELVLRSYEQWGRDCLVHVDGDFALVIWDVRQRTAFCARDRIGNKPLNYHWNGRTLAFSSELHAILRLPWVKQELNEGTLAEFLADEWYSRDESFWTGIVRLVAAHRMDVRADGLRLDKYWEPDLWARLPFTQDEEYAEHYRDTFADIVRRMSRSHRPVAFEVSGGLDSSSIFGMAETLRLRAELPARGIEAHTLDFRGDRDADEVDYARALGEHLAVRIHETPPAYRPLQWYREGARVSGEFPGYPNGTMSLHLRESARANGCRTLIAGEGGDEWLGAGSSGRYYAEELASGNWQAVCACLKADSRSLGMAGAAWRLARFGFAPLLPAPVKRIAGRRRGPHIRRGSWLTPELQATLEVRKRIHQDHGDRQVHRRSQRTQGHVLHDAFGAIARELEERSIARLGLELRLPLYSAGIVQLAFSTPERLRSLGAATKRSHRRAMRNILPRSILDRQTKADFMVTFRRHIDESETEFKYQIPQRRKNWVQPEQIASLVERRHQPHLAGRVEWWLWDLAGCDALV